ncbi:MAG: LacI family transcriptional regulator [Oscillospiraceae bacterium]|nr:LacI family transcriptional regulator [Oscillospiraceae bacterium]
MRKTTINDIAKEAGVSKATVSRVLNHGELVDEETRNRVLDIIQKRRYSPSLVARSLSNRASSTIGIVIPEIDNPFYGKILRTIVNITDAEGLIPVCFDTGNNAEKDVKSLCVLRDLRIGGLIYASSVEHGETGVTKQAKQLLDDMGVPVVLIDRRVPDFQRSGVFFDGFDAGYLSTKILIAAGHVNIGVITGSLKLGIARARLDGYRKAHEECGLPVRRTFIFEGDFTSETACLLSREMLSLPERPSAVLTCNNDTSLGFLQALTERKLKIPRDIEHIGIDEIDVFDDLHMRYNHVTRGRVEMAQEAMALLLTQIRNPDARPESVWIAPRFVLDARLERVAVKHKIIAKKQKGASQP